MEWISVDEKLPDIGQLVLAFMPSPVIRGNHFRICKIEKVSPTDLWWTGDGLRIPAEGEYITTRWISHWTKLPDMPK